MSSKNRTLRLTTAAILAAGPVQAQEHHVRQGAQFKHALAHLAGALPLAGRADGVQVGRFLAHPGLRQGRQVFKQRLQRSVHVLQAVELPVERGRGERDLPFVIHIVLKLGAHGLFCVVLAYADALAAVNTALVVDLRVPVADPDRLRGAAAHTGRTAGAFFDIQNNGMLE